MIMMLVDFGSKARLMHAVKHVDFPGAQRAVNKLNAMNTIEVEIEFMPWFIACSFALLQSCGPILYEGVVVVADDGMC
jgi:hypothetical protein